MKKTPFVGIFIAYCVGLLLAGWWVENHPALLRATTWWHGGGLWSILVWGSGCVCLFVFFWRKQKIPASLSLLLCMLLGVHLKCAKEKRIQQATDDLQAARIHSYRGYLIDEPIATERGHSFLLQIAQLNSLHGSQAVRAKVKIHLFGKLPSLFYGDEICIQGSPTRITPPTNPDVFNYQRYQKRKGICWQDSVQVSHLHRTGRQRGIYLFRFSFFARGYLLQGLAQHLSPASYALVEGILLGNKKALPTETISAFSTAGAMHILAVSGLHVGFVYLLLHALLIVLPNYRWLYLTKTLLLVSGLWLFALLAGCSESVVRAVMMFTTLQFGRLLQRKTTPYNTLGLAATVLAILNPDSVFSISFQLSFVAVLGIVYLQPKLHNLGRPLLDALPYKNTRVVRGIWDLLLVSVSAQMAVLPLTLHYFHLFPTYFLLTNLCLVPPLSLLIPSALLLCGVYLVGFDGVASWIGYGIDALATYMQRIVFFVESLPASKLYPLYVDRWEILISYGVMVLLVAYTSNHRRSYWWATLFFAGLWCIYGIQHHWRLWQQHRIILYHTPYHMAFEYLRGGSIYTHYEASLSQREITRNITPHHIKRGYQTIRSDNKKNLPLRSIIPNVLQIACIANKSFAFLQQGSLLEHPLPPTDYLVLFNKGSEHLDRLGKQLIFRVLIIAPSNSKKHITTLEDLCAKRGWICHNVKKNGSFTQKL